MTIERSTPPPILTPQTTHTLMFDPPNVGNRRWRCACGYTLGDGREQFLARCPLTKTKKGKQSHGTTVRRITK